MEAENVHRLCLSHPECDFSQINLVYFADSRPSSFFVFNDLTFLKLHKRMIDLFINIWTFLINLFVPMINKRLRGEYLLHPANALKEVLVQPRLFSAPTYTAFINQRYRFSFRWWTFITSAIVLKSLLLHSKAVDAHARSATYAILHTIYW